MSDEGSPPPAPEPAQPEPPAPEQAPAPEPAPAPANDSGPLASEIQTRDADPSSFRTASSAKGSFDPDKPGD